MWRSWSTFDDLPSMAFDFSHKLCLENNTVRMTVQAFNFITTTYKCDFYKCRFDGEYCI